MKKQDLLDALKDYYSNRHNPELDLQPNGLWRPPLHNRCSLCKNSEWSSSSGAHLKQPEHYALKHGINPKVFLRARSVEAFGAGSIAWKAVSYIEDSYLTSAQGFKWIPQEVAYAECSGDHEIPDPDCGCGLYFFWNPFSAMEYWSGNIIIKCEVGGKIIEASRGCRAECAVIRGVYHDNGSEKAERVAEMYQVPLIDDPLEDYDVIDEL